MLIVEVGAGWVGMGAIIVNGALGGIPATAQDRCDHNGIGDPCGFLPPGPTGARWAAGGTGSPRVRP